jgi:hypothetical protein
MTKTSPAVILAFHAERLEVDHVWSAVVDFLEKWNAHGLGSTFFVHTLRATMAGKDIRPRLEWLMDHGVEIAQHTHFYDSFEADQSGVRKETSLDSATVTRRLTEDHEYLCSGGFGPCGFVSGGWRVSPAITHWLVSAGFHYDCSLRSFDLPYLPKRDERYGYFTGVRCDDGLLRVPTTSGLTNYYRRAFRTSVAVDEFSYDIVYLHDKDLLNRGKRALLSALPLLGKVRRTRWIPVGRLANEIEVHLDG